MIAKCKKYLIFALILLVFLVLLFFPFFDPNPHLRKIIADDFMRSFPWINYAVDNFSVRDLSLSHWNQYASAGTPMITEASQYYYPLLLLKIASIARQNFIPFKVWELFLVLQYIIAGFGMYLFLETKTTKNYLVIFGSLFFLVAGLMHAIVWPLFIAGFALVPWILLFLEKYFKTTRFIWLALAAFLSFQLLAVAPQLFFYLLLFIAGYTLVVLKDWRLSLKRLLPFYILALLYSMIIVLPLSEFSGYAVRNNYLSSDVLNFMAVKGQDIFQLVFFPAEGYTYLYLGIPAVFVIIAGLAQKKSRSDFLLLALAVILYFFSTNSSLFNPILRMLPGLNLLRWHSRLVEFEIILLIILLVRGLANYRFDYRRDLGIAGALGVVAILGYFLHASFSDVNLNSLAFSLFFLALVGMLIYARKSLIIDDKLLTIAVCLLILLDLSRVYLDLRKSMIWSVPLNKIGQVIPGQWYNGPNATYNFGSESRLPVDDFMQPDYNKFMINQNYSAGSFSSAGSDFSAATLKRYDDYLKMAKINKNLLDLANINYGSNSFLPRAFTLPCYKVEVDDEAVLDKMSQADFSGRDFLYLNSRSEGNLIELTGQTCSEKLKPVAVDQGKDQINFPEIESGKETLLFISDNYYPGWNAYVNGHKTEILQADYTFKAVVLPVGKNQVEFRYEPRSSKIGGLLTLVTLFVSLAYLGFQQLILKRRKAFKK